MKRSTWTLAAALGALVSLSHAARAEDPKSASLSVHPATGASIVISDKEKMGVIALDYRALTSGLSFNLQASAPLDEKTRMASFLGENKLIGGFSTGISIGYDSAYAATALTEAERKDGLTKLCEKIPELKAGGCQDEDLSAWAKKNPDNPEWKQYQDQLLGAKERRLNGLRNMRQLPDIKDADDHESIRFQIAADLSFSYDRLSTYRVNLSDDKKDAVKYELLGGVSGTAYLTRNFAVNLRAGGSVAQTPGAKTVKRCTSVPSADDKITGSDCQDVLFLAGEPDGPKGSAYVRAALTFSAIEKHFGGYPGAELRAAVENIAQAPHTDLRLVGFFSPELGPAAARFGVGFDVSIAMTNDSASGVSAGDPTFTPFVFVGASPTKW